MCNVLCKGCFEEIKDTFDKYEIMLNEEDIESRREDDDEDNKCISCGTLIEKGDIFFNTDFSDVNLSLSIEELADTLSQDIDACFNCQGREIDEYYYQWNKDADEEEYQEKSIGISVEAFLYNHDIPQLLHQVLTNQLQCQCCQYGKYEMHPKHNPDGGVFDLDDEVYTQKEIDDFWGFDYEEFSEFASEYGIYLNITELYGFKEYISENPLLAFKHPVGQKIFEVLKAHYEAGDYIKLEKGKVLYRGRSRNVDGEMLKRSQMWSPPKGVASHGRYNLIGTSVLYCADKIKGIPFEIHPRHNEAVDIGIFEIKKDLKLLNIGFFANFSGFFSEKDVDTKTLKEVYLLPNFMRDCCYDIGYNGVKYKGVYEDEKYTNFAFFNFEADVDIKIKKVYTLNMKIKYIVDEED